jgi:type II secretory pathway predicted ATPase ExeA
MARFSSPLSELYAAELRQAVQDNGFTALVGEFGAGKTHLMRGVKAAFEGQSVVFVESSDLTDRRLTVASLLADVVRQLTTKGETPMRSLAALSHQAVRILGQATGGGRRVCLVVDDAHRLHPETLSALKRLRERDFAGRSPLLSVVLLGHTELADALAARNEVGWRCDVLSLTEEHGWMTAPERVRFLEATYGDGITADARTRIAALCTLPEQMVQMVREKGREARRLGLDRINGDVVRPSLAELKDAIGGDASIRKIAAEAGVSPKVVHEAVHAGETNPHSEPVRAAMERIAARTQGTEPAARRAA